MKLSCSLVRRTFPFLLLSVAMPPFVALASPLLPASGDSASVLILSDRVGPVIDAEEAKQYHLFSQISGLKEAIAVELPDSSTAVLFAIGGPEKLTVDSLIYYSESTLKMIAEKIDHFEGVSDGSYKMGTEPSALRPGGYKVPLHAGYQRSLPIHPSVAVAASRPPTIAQSGGSVYLGGQLSRKYPREEFYPTFQITVSVHSFSPDTKGLDQTLGSGVSFGAPLCIGVEISFSRLIAFHVEGGSTIGSNNSAGQATLGPVFYLPLFADPRIKPFLGAGYTMTSVRAEGNGLGMEAGSKGFYLSAGLEYILGTAAGASLYGMYSGLGTVSTTYPEYYAPPPGQPTGVPASIDFSHMALGFRLTFFL